MITELQDSGETRKNFEDITNGILHKLFNFQEKENNKENNIKFNLEDSDNFDDNKQNDLDEDWRFNSSENLNDKKDEKLILDIEENFRPFDIDTDKNYKKKRNHHYIENDILKYLYN